MAKKSKPARKPAPKAAQKAAPKQKASKSVAKQPKAAVKSKTPVKSKVAAKSASPATASAPPPTSWAWHEVMTSDLGAAKSFYTSLFGWSAQDMQMPTGPYTVFTKGGEQVGGCMTVPQHEGKPVCPPHWLSYLRVDDVDATVAKARTLGARVDVAGMDVPGVGRFAILGDPSGATFAVYRNA